MIIYPNDLTALQVKGCTSFQSRLVLLKDLLMLLYLSLTIFPVLFLTRVVCLHSLSVINLKTFLHHIPLGIS